MASHQPAESLGYYIASACSGASCVVLWLAENKDAITAACAIIGVLSTLVFGGIGLYTQMRRK